MNEEGKLSDRLPHLLVDFESLLGALKRQRHVLVLTSMAVALLLGFLLAVQTPLYESTSLLLVKFGRELIYQPEIGDGQAMGQRDKQAVLNSELAILRSQPVMESVVRDIGLGALYPDLAEREKALRSRPDNEEAQRQRNLLYVEGGARLAQALTAQALPEAHVLRVSFRHSDPVVAADAVNAAVEHFTEKHLEAFAEPELVRFLTSRVEQYREGLADSEHALRVFETEHRAFALDDYQGILLQRRDEANRELADLDREISDMRRRELQEGTVISEARRELLALKLEQSRVKGKLREDVTERIAVVELFIAARQEERENEVAILEGTRAQLQEQIAIVDQDLAEMPRLAAQYREVRRERDANEEQYSTYLKRLREARLSHEMDSEKLASINVIQPAFPAPIPVWPTGYLLSSVVVLVVAIISGVLCATLCDAFNIGLPRRSGRGGPARR